MLKCKVLFLTRLGKIIQKHTDSGTLILVNFFVLDITNSLTNEKKDYKIRVC